MRRPRHSSRCVVRDAATVDRPRRTSTRCSTRRGGAQTVTQSFTGAVAYTRYGWWYRWYLKRISRRKGLPTDTSRDWDFTEWSEVERFAEKLAVMFAPASAKHPVHAS